MLKILRKKKDTEPSVYVTWISTQNLNKRKLSQKLISCGRLLVVVVVGTSGSHVPLPHQCPSFFWALGKVWASLERSLEATRDYSHLKFKGPPRKVHCLFPQILESGSTLPAESKLINSQLDRPWGGPGGRGMAVKTRVLDWKWEMCGLMTRH